MSGGVLPVSTEAHPTAEREPAPERIYRGLLEPDPEPRPRRLTVSEQGSLIGALTSLVLADLDARREGAR